MADDWTTDQWEDAIRGVFRQAMLDRKFRELALRDAPAAFTEVTGRPPPPGLKLRFVDELAEHVLVLPKLAVTQETPSEIDLSRVLYHSFRQQSIPPGFPPASPGPSC